MSRARFGVLIDQLAAEFEVLVKQNESMRQDTDESSLGLAVGWNGVPKTLRSPGQPPKPIFSPKVASSNGEPQVIPQTPTEIDPVSPPRSPRTLTEAHVGKALGKHAQSVQLQPVLEPNECVSSISFSPADASSMTLRPPEASVTFQSMNSSRNRISGNSRNTSSRNSGDTPKIVAPPEEALQGAQRAEDRLRAQFERLDANGCGVLSAEFCCATVREYVSWDESLLERVTEAVARIGKEQVTRHHSSAETETVVGIDVQAFCKLCVPHQVKRHASIMDPLSALSMAFEKEDLDNFLHDAKKKARKRHLSREPPKAVGLVAVWLDIIPACVICINAVVMGLQQDLAPDSTVWEVLELVFLACYVTESLMKIWVYSLRVYCCGHEKYWNWFDMICITLSAIDILISAMYTDANMKNQTLMKMLRLVRLARLVRALKYPIFDDLKLMIYGVVSGVKVLAWALLLLFVCIFFLGMLLNKLTDGNEELLTVPASMFTVFRCFTDGCVAYDGTPLAERLRKRYPTVFFIAYILVYMFVTFGLFNLIMAIFINNVISSSLQRKQIEIGESADKTRQAIECGFAKLILSEQPSKRKSAFDGNLQKLSPELARRKSDNDADLNLLSQLPNDLQIPREVFNLWMHDRDVTNMLKFADIDVSAKFDLFDVLDVDMGGALGLDELISGLMSMRGPITKSDIVAVRLQVHYVTKLVDGIFSHLGCEYAAQDG